MIQSKILINQCFQAFLFFTCIYLKKMCYICYKWINLLCINGFHVASTFFYMLHFFVKFAKSSTSQRISCSTKRATFLKKSRKTKSDSTFSVLSLCIILLKFLCNLISTSDNTFSLNHFLCMQCYTNLPACIHQSSILAYPSYSQV